jgi:hypothetical protein
MPVERHTFKQRRLQCAACGLKSAPLLWSYDPLPACACGGTNELDYGPANRSAAVIADDIPGGIVIEHGLTGPNGEPRTYYSKSEMAREAKARGLVNWVEHVPERGSDKSPFTSRWV